jgi:hypothetical protein
MEWRLAGTGGREERRGYRVLVRGGGKALETGGVDGCTEMSVYLRF